MRSYFLLFLFLAPVSVVFSQSKPASQFSTAKKFKTLDSLLLSEVNGDKIPGAVIQVKKGKQGQKRQQYQQDGTGELARQVATINLHRDRRANELTAMRW